MRCEATDFAADAYPLSHDLDGNDEDGARKLIVPLQIDLVAWPKTRTVHQFLRQ